MKTYLDCYPCFLRQALSASRRAMASEDQQRRILLSTMEELLAMPADATPPQMALRIHQQVRQQTQVDDPYREDKEKATQQAQALYPMLKGQVSGSADPLETAVRIAIAGNIIDAAELIIAKGQANYESLSGQAAPIFFLLQAKCSVIVKDIGAAPGGIVIKQQLPDG